MFEFQNLEVYKKTKVFHISCKHGPIPKVVDQNIFQQLICLAPDIFKMRLKNAAFMLFQIRNEAFRYRTQLP